MTERSTIDRSGLGLCFVTCDHPDKVLASSSASHAIDMRDGDDELPTWLIEQIEQVETPPDLILMHANAYVNTGLNNSLDREWGLGGTAIGWIGVDNNSTAVTASTVYLHGAAGATAANQIIKAISPAATRTNQTTTGGATFANADFTSGVFVINKLGLLNTSTDAGTGLIDVIGGTGGSSPYNRTFVLDLTGAGTFSATLQIAVTAQAA